MNSLTLLKTEELFGNNALNVINKFGTKAIITDFSILLGGLFNNNYYIGDNNSLYKRTGIYWTQSDNGYGAANVIINDGSKCDRSIDMRTPGIRPVIQFNEFIMLNSEDDIVEYGNYPQNSVPSEIEDKLEELFRSDNLNKTNNFFTTDSRKPSDFEKSFEPQNFTEYIYNGKKYIRVKSNIYNFNGNEFYLSNGKKYSNGDYVWIEVLPIKWLVDNEKHLLISEKIICAGIQFDNNKNIGKYHINNFNNTNIKFFLDNYLFCNFM